MQIHPRLGCSTISFRGLPLAEALVTISRLGFAEIDLGALPGVCDHVPYVLDRAAVAAVAAEVQRSGLNVRSVNGDIGDLNAILDAAAIQARREHLDRLLELTAAVGARALVLPNGALDHQPVQSLAADIERVAAELTYAADRAREHGLELWVESLHLFRLCHDLDRAQQLTDALAETEVGVVLDVSHIVASGSRPEEFIDRFADRIRHVHLRDATPGNIHHSIGNGAVDFAGTIEALDRAGYTGHLTLELETRDVADTDRPAAAQAAGHFISKLLSTPHHLSPRSSPMSTPQRTAIITGVGAERGIGRGAAHRFARDGWAVVGLDLDGPAAEKLAAELGERYGVPAVGRRVDVADEASVAAARVAVAVAGLPSVGAVVNIAGITSPVPFLDTTLELWNRIFAVNATGTYLVTKAFLPEMIEAGYGRIINMSSVSAQQGGGVFGKTPYSAAKAAVIGFTRSLARELGPTGITVNAIAAGAVDTDIRADGTTPELEASIVAGVPLGRQASVDDVTALIGFLASEEAGYLTGTTQNLNGGSYIA